MNIELPVQIVNIIESLNEHYYSAYVTGECVRDTVAGKRTVADYDIVTNAEFPRIAAIFEDKYPVISSNSEKGEYLMSALGTSVLLISRAEPVEQVLAESVFSILAVAYNPKTGFTDPFGGLNCFNGSHDGRKAFILDTVPNVLPAAEDIMYALISMAEGDYIISDKTKELIIAGKTAVSVMPAETLRKSLDRIIGGKRVADVLSEYSEVFFIAIPELELLHEFYQNKFYEKGRDEYDLYTHTCKSIGYAPPVLTLRYGLLFHALGKPETMTSDKNGNGHFRGHCELGRIYARRICRRLGFDADTASEIEFLTENHDFALPDSDDEHGAVQEALLKVPRRELRLLLLMQYANLRGKSEDFEREATVLKRLADALR